MNVIVFTYRTQLLGVIEDKDYTTKEEQDNIVRFVKNKLEIVSNDLRNIEYYTSGNYYVFSKLECIEVEFTGDNGIITVRGYKCLVVDVKDFSSVIL